jgi:hypothetical protein
MAALALPTGAQAAQPCAKDMPGPANVAWVVMQNGALRQSSHFGGGSAFDENQGQLFVNGAEYTAVPNDPPKCTATATSITFPSQTLGGLSVSRSLSSTGPNGLMRTLDTITNPAAQQKVITVDYRIKVLGSQNSVKSESGNDTVNSADHWAVLKSSGAFPFLQWGEDGADDEAAVKSDDVDSPNEWRPKVTTMPDANLHYEQVVIGAGQTVRLLHTIGGTTSQATSTSAAADSATPFAGYSKAVAKQITNWGSDPDKDGVSKFNDDCPSVKGNTQNGCVQFQPPPPNGDDPAPDPQQPQPQPQPDPGTSDPAPTVPVDPAVPPVKKDKTAPVVSVTKLSTSAKKSLVTGKGLAPRIRCNESCTVTVRAQVQRKGSKKLGTILTLKGKKASASTQKLTIKVKSKAIAKLAKQRVTLIITAVDAAGNKRTVTKTVKLTS